MSGTETKPAVLAETGRLLITELAPDMAPAIHANSLDEDMRAYVPDEVFETPEAALEAVGFLMAQYGGTDGPLVYAVLTKDGENVGYVQLVPLEDGRREIGYHIGKRYTGRGYASEAVTAFLPVIARKVGVREILGVCLAENAASVRVLEKCGFRRDFTGTGLYQGAPREIVRAVWTLKEAD